MADLSNDVLVPLRSDVLRLSRREIATLKGMVSGQGDLTLGVYGWFPIGSATGSLRLNECEYGSEGIKASPYSDS